MTLEPLLHAPLMVQLHVATLALAFLAGAWLLVFSRKGSRLHRIAGVGFIALMVLTALITLFIHRQMPHSPVFGLSPTHLTVVVVLVLCWLAVTAVLRGNFLLHRLAVFGLFFGALVINGAVQIFLVPGIAHDVFLNRQVAVADTSHRPSRIAKVQS